MTQAESEKADGLLPYQARVGDWMNDVFAVGGADLRARTDRFIEEVFELAQALDYSPTRIGAIRDYVFGRPIGDPAQETGGVMVTLASLCHVAGIDMATEGERELARIHRPDVRAKIMAKQASKNSLHTPLPTANAPSAAPDLVEALQWYAEKAADCRKVTREGEAGRLALENDGGARARAALASIRSALGGER